MEYKIIRSEEEFSKEKENWDDLIKMSNDSTPFQTWDWCFTWWKNREEKDSLFIIKAFEAKTVFGYAPLVVKNKMVEFIGGKDMDYGRFLIKDNYMEIIQGFVDEIKKAGYGVAFQEMAAANTQLHIIEKILEHDKNYLVRQTTRTSRVVLENYETIEEYLDSLSGRFRKSLRRIDKKGLRFEKETISPQLYIVLEEIFSDRQETRGGSHDFSWAIPIINELGKIGQIEVYIAYLNSTPIAFHIVFNNSNKRYVWLIAHKKEFEKYSPGRFLRYNIIKKSFGEGVTCLDNMRGDYEYKMEWNAILDTNYTVYVFLNKKKYLKAKIWFWIRPKIKKIVYSNEWLKKVYKKHA